MPRTSVNTADKEKVDKTRDEACEKNRIDEDDSTPLTRNPTRIRMMAGKEREKIMDTQSGIMNQYHDIVKHIENIFATDNENTQIALGFMEEQQEYIKKQRDLLEAEKAERQREKQESRKRDGVGYVLGSITTTTAVVGTAATGMPVDGIINSGSGAMTIGIGCGRAAYQQFIDLCDSIASCFQTYCFSKCCISYGVSDANKEKNVQAQSIENIQKSLEELKLMASKLAAEIKAGEKNAHPKLITDAIEQLLYEVDPSLKDKKNKEDAEPDSTENLATSTTEVTLKETDVKLKADVKLAKDTPKKLKKLAKNATPKEIYIGSVDELVQKQFEHNKDILALITGKKEQLDKIKNFISSQTALMDKQARELDADKLAKRLDREDKAEGERVGYLCGTGLAVTGMIVTGALGLPAHAIFGAGGGGMTCGIGLGRGYHRLLGKCKTYCKDKNCCCSQGNQNNDLPNSPNSATQLISPPSNSVATPPKSPLMDRKDRKELGEIVAVTTPPNSVNIMNMNTNNTNTNSNSNTATNSKSETTIVITPLKERPITPVGARESLSPTSISSVRSNGSDSSSSAASANSKVINTEANAASQSDTHPARTKITINPSMSSSAAGTGSNVVTGSNKGTPVSTPSSSPNSINPTRPIIRTGAKIGTGRNFLPLAVTTGAVAASNRYAVTTAEVGTPKRSDQSGSRARSATATAPLNLEVMPSNGQGAARVITTPRNNSARRSATPVRSSTPNGRKTNNKNII